MATRIEIQAAQDILRFMNIINDLFDGMVNVLEDKVKNHDGSDATILQKQNAVASTLAACQSYSSKIRKFINDNPTIASNGLNVFQTSSQDIITELDTFDANEAQMRALLTQDSNGSKLTEIVTYKKSVISQLQLVRNS